jgi:hypothetical protein
MSNQTAPAPPVVATSSTSAAAIWLGEYRDWGNLTIYHLFTFAGIFVISAFWYAIVLTRRVLSNKKMRAAIPRVVSTADPDPTQDQTGLLLIGRESHSKKVADAIDKLDQNRSTCDRELQPEGFVMSCLYIICQTCFSACCSQTVYWMEVVVGFSIVCLFTFFTRFIFHRISNMLLSRLAVGSIVNISDEILQSYIKIDAAVAQRRPGLRHRKFRTVREFIDVLQSEFPTISRDACQEYVEIYESVRYGQCRPAQLEWTKVNEFVATIVNEVDRA